MPAVILPATPAIVVAGHICLDIIPTFPLHAGAGNSRIEPGKLYDMGPALFSTGGAVSNTGLAIHRLGLPTTLMGKIADDLFGGQILTLLRQQVAELAEGMIVADSGDTSYSIVISPPGVDRSFLHCPGSNDTFSAEDVDVSTLQPGQIFHFGYPPLMRRFYADVGEEMSRLLTRVSARGLFTSLDMAMPDPQSPAGQIDWRLWLQRTLPLVDLFLPSIDELLVMTGIENPTPGFYSPELLEEVTRDLFAWGAAIVAVKLGDQGLYLRTSGDLSALEERFPADREFLSHWLDRELYVPCFQVQVAGTTGAGDCTIAGFLAAFAQRKSPEECLRTAVAVGGCSVEAADSTSGIRSLCEIRQRIAAGWPQQPPAWSHPQWTSNPETGVWFSQTDSKA